MKISTIVESLLVKEKDGLSIKEITDITNLPIEDVEEGINNLKLSLKEDKYRGVKVLCRQGKYILVPKFNIQSKENSKKQNLKLLEEFLNVLDLRGRAESTLETYKYVLGEFIRLVDRKFQRIKVRDVRNYIKAMKDKGNCKNTISTKISILKSLFKWLSREDYIKKNIMDKIIKPKTEDKSRKFLTEEEIEKIRQVDMKLIDRVLFEVLYSSGIRVSEVVNLNWEDINFTTRELKVKQGKGSKDRVTFLSIKAILLLRKYRRNRNDSDKCVFRSNYRRRMSKSSIIRHIKEITRKADIGKKVTPHHLRHSCATHLLKSGMSLDMVQKVLGHSKVSTTQLYAKTNMDDVSYNYKKINL